MLLEWKEKIGLTASFRTKFTECLLKSLATPSSHEMSFSLPESHSEKSLTIFAERSVLHV